MLNQRAIQAPLIYERYLKQSPLLHFRKVFVSCFSFSEPEAWEPWLEKDLKTPAQDNDGDK